MKSSHPPGPPMDLANMRRQGVHHLIAYCLNDSCRHQALIDVSKYPGDTPVPWFGSKVVCAKCGQYVFTGYNTKHNRVRLDNKSMRMLLWDMGVQVTVHGFRTSFRNWGAEKTDFDFYLLEMCLAHAVGNAAIRAYLRGDALEKRRVIMEAWAAYIEPPPVELKPALTLVRATA